jgi:hypothetical protein
MSYSNIAISPCEPQELPLLFTYKNINKFVINIYRDISNPCTNSEKYNAKLDISSLELSSIKCQCIILKIYILFEHILENSVIFLLYMCPEDNVVMKFRTLLSLKNMYLPMLI